MIAPHCLIRGHHSTGSFLGIFAGSENGFVGLAVRFVTDPGTKQLHVIESSPLSYRWTRPFWSGVPGNAQHRTKPNMLA